MYSSEAEKDDLLRYEQVNTTLQINASSFAEAARILREEAGNRERLEISDPRRWTDILTPADYLLCTAIELIFKAIIDTLKKKKRHLEEELNKSDEYLLTHDLKELKKSVDRKLKEIEKNPYNEIDSNLLERATRIILWGKYPLPAGKDDEKILNKFKNNENKNFSISTAFTHLKLKDCEFEKLFEVFCYHHKLEQELWG